MKHIPTAFRGRRNSAPPFEDADEVAADRRARRRPFSALMKKLANLKGPSAGDGSRLAGSKRNPMMGQKARLSKKHNPYPQSGRTGNGCASPQSRPSLSTAPGVSSATSLGRSGSNRSSLGSHPPPTTGGRSMAPTVSTDHEASRSITAPSHGAPSLAGTSRTANGTFESRRGGDSTFSSPSPSVRSLTTTLTTIQSVAPTQGSAAGSQPGHSHNHSHGLQPSTSQSIQFNQPFPTASPASAIPSHLTPLGYHPTYTIATANNVLTDNASIVTLASSSNRRRRQSLDTDASVRALAPSSLFGGSRESLPLSVLSANVDGSGAAAAGGPTTPGLHQSGSRVGAGGGAATERTSIYSTTGIILASERNSLYAKAGGLGGDGASVRSGLLGHGRADSVTGSIGGMASPLASPREEREREIGMSMDDHVVPEDEE